MTLNSQSLNLTARQILFKRLTTTQAMAYTGPLGEIVVDTTLKQLRVQDGLTPGGVLNDGIGNNFDFGAIVPPTITNILELIIYTANIDLGTFTNPALINYDAGPLV